MYVHVIMGGQRSAPSVFLSHSPWFFRQAVPLNAELTGPTMVPGLQAAGLQGSACLCLLSTGITVCATNWALSMGSGNRTQVLMLAR